ncbi:MAG: NAD-dependent epimerase/dehydratase family protein [Flavobacteriales bacterium]
MSSKKILIIGACGQIGIELTAALRAKFGVDAVIASDVRPAPHPALVDGPYLKLDAMDSAGIADAVESNQITDVYLLAALLSANAEKDPMFAWRLNMEGLFNVLELAKAKKIQRIFWPSSIAVFGPSTPRYLTPQNTIMEPTTVYGISKLAGERWCEYYFNKFGVDVRSVRYPGLIGYKSAPGGGTTDYAVDIFHQAIRSNSYTCFLKGDTALPMMMMEDAIRATIELMEAEADQVRIRSSYNLNGCSFTPEDLALIIREQIPAFTMSYAPDFRQAIADSWPASIDDSAAQQDWGWKTTFDTDRLARTMLSEIQKQVQQESATLS